MREIILALRWFWLNCRLILLCLQIAFWSRLSIAVTRWQVRLFRWSGIGIYRPVVIGMLSFFAILCGGCASAPKPQISYAPSNSAVIKAVASAKNDASNLAAYVAPEGKAKLAALTASLDQAQFAVAEYSAKVDEVSRQLGEAREQVTYESEKRMKALRQLWTLRIILLIEIGALLGYVGLRTGWKFAMA